MRRLVKRRLALLVPVVLAGSLALTGCSGGGPAVDASSGKTVATVIDGMHYVQLFDAVDPVVAQLSASVSSLPPSAELRTAAGSLQQFAAQAHGLPSSGSDGRTTLDRLAVASSTLAGQFTTLAAKGTLSPGATQVFTSALEGYQSAAAAARRAAGLPAVVIERSPHADTGP